jgi:hypothetical protein
MNQGCPGERLITPVARAVRFPVVIHVSSGAEKGVAPIASRAPA